MNVVTGSTGILGSHVLLKLMELGLPVIACKRNTSDLQQVRRLFSYYGKEDLFERVLWKEADVDDVYSLEDVFDGAETVYHCAGFVSFNTNHRKKLFKINEGGTSNVVNACIEKRVGALCHVSSVGTINNSDFKGELDENVYWKTSGRESDYAISKYNAEREVWRAAEEGLNTVIVNPGVILSPGFWTQSSSKIFSVIDKGNAFYTDGMTGYVAARDVAAVMIELMRGKHYGQRFIIVENNYGFKDIFDLVSKHLGRKAPFIKASRGMLQTARFFNYLSSKITGKEQVVTGAMIHSSLNKQRYLNAKIRQFTQYNFNSIESEIAQICRVYCQERDQERGKRL